MLTRRQFVIASVGTALAGRQSAPERSQPPAREIVDRIRAGVGLPWRATTIDGIKAGDPNTTVTGITTTVMATLEVLRQAAASRRNFIVTTEPVFYSGNDEPGTRANDPVYVAKRAFIDENRLVVFRFADHWHARVPNESVRALAAALDWTRHRTPANESIYKLPETTLRSLSAHVQKRLGVRGLRVVGRPDMRVATVLLSPATTDLPGTVRNLPQADVLLAGEPREWEAVPYVLDTAPAGRARGLIAVGRIVSEEPGARACAEWLRTIVPSVTVEPTTVADPYWRPTV
jgi:putative NIF3 family GTP cyclohydrolase 1 type 2